MESLTSFEALSNKELLILVALLVWSLIWKGMALWKSGRNGDKGWFIAMLILNTLGILEIIYIVAFSKDEENPVDTKRQGA